MSRPTSRRTLLKRASGLAALSAFPAALRAGPAAAAGDPALDALATTLADKAWGRAVRPGAPEHAKIKYWNARFDCVRSATYVRPATIEGIVHVIQWAKQNGRTFAIRGGGHSFEGKSSHADLVIDMSQMTKLFFDAATSTLQVQAGVLLGEVYKTLGSDGHILPAGTCPTVGVVGHALGGGIGDFLPMFGYAAQSLSDVQLVTLNGTALTVSDERITNVSGAPLPAGVTAKDLMQVLRGGGQGSLGVVTAMSFKTQNVRATQILHFQLKDADQLSEEKTVAILQGWQAWRERQPKPMQSLVSSKLNLSRSAEGFDIEIAGLAMVPPGSRVTLAEIKSSLDTLYQLPHFRTRKPVSKPLSAVEAVKTFLDDDETTHNPTRKMLVGSSSALPSALPKPALEHLARAFPKGVFASFYTAGGKSAGGPATSLHPCEFMVEWVSWTPRPDPEGARRLRKINADMLKLANFEDRGVPNYPDGGPRDYFSNEAKIEALRAAFDPDTLSTSSLSTRSPRPAADASCR